MMRFITPHLRLENVLELTLERLQTLELRGLMLDLDCTLKDYHSPSLPETVAAWVRAVADSGMRLCLVSNSKPHKLQPFAKQLDIPFVSNAWKPLPLGCQTGLKLLGLKATQAGFVGDQLFADVLAGRLAGLFTILVKPSHPAEPWFTKLKRPLERYVLQQLHLRELRNGKKIALPMMHTNEKTKR